MAVPQRVTWVRYFRYLIDEAWNSEATKGMTDQQRLEYVLRPHWRAKLKSGEFQRNGYRRRVWRRVALDKFRRRRLLNRKKKSGLVAGWILA